MGDISLRALDALGKVDAVACEDTREAGKLFSVYDIVTPKLPYHEHNAAEMRPRIVRMIAEGRSVALISDAGMPLISDPGYKLVEACRAEGLNVTCVPGASASLTGLVLSGLPTDRFFFAGFLPPRSAARKTVLQEIRAVPGTLVFYETAPRLADSLSDMQDVLGDRPAAVARELTKKFEEVRKDSLSGLGAHYREAGPPRGEIVVVVGAAPAGAAQEALSEKDIDALLQDRMDAGFGVKDAAAFVAARTGLKKSDLYQRALQLKNDGRGS